MNQFSCHVTNQSLHLSGELPGVQTLYEFFYDGEKKQWIPWSKMVPTYVHNPDLKFYEILVPTVDTVRATWLLEMMVNIKRPVVLVGETGTSKTATIANFLRTVDQDSHVSFHSEGRMRWEGMAVCVCGGGEDECLRETAG